MGLTVDEFRGTWTSTSVAEQAHQDVMYWSQGSGISLFLLVFLTSNIDFLQGYKIIGSHSGVKICRWTKSQLRGRGGCYKHSFYGIESHRYSFMRFYFIDF